MTTIQWEEDWFTVQPSTATESARQDNARQDKPGQDNARQEEPGVQEINRRLEELTLLVHQQSQQLSLLSQELQEWKQHAKEQKPPTESSSSSSSSSSAVTQIADLLEELKRVKERELNYALRRHVAVPFFDSGMVQRMAPLEVVKPPRSPLFRGATATRGPSL